MAFGNIDNWIERHKDDIDGNGKKIYTCILDMMEIDGLSYHTKTSNLENIKRIGVLCPEINYFKLTDDDIQKIQVSIVKKHKNKKTVRNLKNTLRKWLQCSNQSELLNLVKAVNTKSADKLPDDMLTPQEIELMLDHCTTTRDQAIIALLYDSGCRVGELLSMRVRDVEFDDNGAIVTYPEGKTGWRKNRVVYATAYLRQWLANHEYKNNPEAPLFYSLRGEIIDKNKDASPENKRLKGLTGEAVRRQLHIIATNSGIKRRVHPHLFRHTRASELANHMTEQQLKKHFGWGAGSNMAALYVHLSDRDVEKAFLKASGIKVTEDEDNRPQPIKCPRCREFNPPQAAYCFRCGLMLSQKLDKEVNEVMEALKKRIMDDPSFLVAALNNQKP
ncbi:MAG: tyrosine-type recombinase/integrase [Methanosarcinaceae archaeon]|nr:tyrosine-type recombinase/integrase [Methanosarcinaceae archaeon]